MTVRPWAGRADTAAMQQLVSRRWPHSPHPGGVGWATAIGQLADPIAVVDGGAGLAGWAGLAEAGFTLQAGAAPVTGMFHDASPVSPVLPDGYRVRSVADGEQAARLEAHRAAWRPATLPWPGDVASTVSPDLTSRFTAGLYEEVRHTWLYDQSRDLVVEAPDGTFAACCIAWWDPAARCTEIEPLGVLPGHRRLGLATAMCMAVCALTAGLGGDQVFINVGPRADYPAPAATYLAAGFRNVTVGQVHHRPGAGAPGPAPGSR